MVYESFLLTVSPHLLFTCFHHYFILILYHFWHQVASIHSSTKFDYKIKACWMSVCMMTMWPRLLHCDLIERRFRLPVYSSTINKCEIPVSVTAILFISQKNLTCTEATPTFTFRIQSIHQPPERVRGVDHRRGSKFTCKNQNNNRSNQWSMTKADQVSDQW